MKRLLILLGVVASAIAPVYATPIQPQSSDFKLESWISQKDKRAPSKYPLINIRVRYVGESELSVVPIGMAPHQIFLGTPEGWKARPLNGTSGFMGQANISPD